MTIMVEDARVITGGVDTHAGRVRLVSSERVGHAPSVYWPCAVPG